MTRTFPAEAYILCGGKSTRFGSPKARYMLDGTTLIQRLFLLLDGLFEQTTLVCKREGDYQDLDLPTIADAYPAYAPLVGLLTALEHSRTEWTFITACDLPNLSEWLIRWLWDQRNGLGVIPATQDHLHPLTAVYHRSSLTLFSSAYQRKEYALHPILKIPAFKKVTVPDSSILWNINQLDDLRKE
ncbi:MAG: molybdenum cofactor guanylyltransferase [Fidelibacterota bacterium]|nr:MAG: molybdenum cofactor guanylyltransferase [Candidatus Neomarinimicrobiota bacterium]